MRIKTYPAIPVNDFSSARQHRIGIEVEHFLPTLGAGVGQPGIGQQGDDRVVQVGRLAARVAGGSDRTQAGTGEDRLARIGVEAIEMGVVMQAPLGRQHQDDLAAEGDLPAIEGSVAKIGGSQR